MFDGRGLETGFWVGAGGSGLAVVCVVIGVLSTVWVLGVFLSGERYRRPPRLLSPAEYRHYRREAEAGISDLAPRVILLSEKERVLERADDESRRAAGEFWRKFAVASLRVEDDPRVAIEELRPLPALVDLAISDLERAVSAETNKPP